VVIKLISYNIQRGICLETLFAHITSIRDFQEADIIVVQEACVPKNGVNTLSRLLQGFTGKYLWSYRTVMTYPDKEYGNGFIFKEDWVPVAEEVVPFPQVDRLKWYEKRKTEGGAPDTKSAFVQTFRVRQRLVRIANVHMDFVGGAPHRQAQLRRLLSFLSRGAQGGAPTAGAPDLDVICGDFNTVGHFRSPKAQQKTRSVLELALNQGYIDCSEQIDWTSDLFSNIDADDPARAFFSLCKALKLHFRQKTDHVLARGLKSILQAKKISLPKAPHLPGSDHVPLYVELEI